MITHDETSDFRVPKLYHERACARTPARLFFTSEIGVSSMSKEQKSFPQRRKGAKKSKQASSDTQQLGVLPLRLCGKLIA
jgi:hypothetical protein